MKTSDVMSLVMMCAELLVIVLAASHLIYLTDWITGTIIGALYVAAQAYMFYQYDWR